MSAHLMANCRCRPTQSSETDPQCSWPKHGAHSTLQMLLHGWSVISLAGQTLQLGLADSLARFTPSCTPEQLADEQCTKLQLLQS